MVADKDLHHMFDMISNIAMMWTVKYIPLVTASNEEPIRLTF